MHKFELRHLRTFIAVAEESSFRKAAIRLHVAQPAVSRTIQQLEQALDAQLLDRSTRTVQLTEIGRFLLGRARVCQGSLKETVESVRRMSLGMKGELVVGFNDFTISEILPPVIHRLRSTYPEIVVNLADEPSVRMSQMVLENSLDIAFLSGVPPPTELDSFPLREEKFVVLLPRGHALEKRSKIHVNELKDERFVLGDPEWSLFLKTVDAYCETAGFRPRVTQTAVHSHDIINFVAAGIGVSIYVDRHWLRFRKYIAVRPLTGARITFQSIAVWRRNPRSQALSNLIQVMRDVIS